MAQQSLKTYYKTLRDENMQIIYNLQFKNALYSLECYRDGMNGTKNYSYIENLTDDEGEAETFLKLVAKGKVLPVHMKDLVEDYFMR